MDKKHNNIHYWVLLNVPINVTPALRFEPVAKEEILATNQVLM